MNLKVPNTIIEMEDGTIGTTCYNGLDGIGIKYGKHFFNINNEFPEPDLILKEPETLNLKLIKQGGWSEDRE